MDDSTTPPGDDILIIRKDPESTAPPVAPSNETANSVAHDDASPVSNITVSTTISWNSSATDTPAKLVSTYRLTDNVPRRPTIAHTLTTVAASSDSSLSDNPTLVAMLHAMADHFAAQHRFKEVQAYAYDA
ncbi:hypothetical protein HDE_07894 [Halotydeus destructor]|nr:hypothetical protein HDE_07894 [Halotydeus destructor]